MVCDWVSEAYLKYLSHVHHIQWPEHTHIHIEQFVSFSLTLSLYSLFRTHKHIPHTLIVKENY